MSDDEGDRKPRKAKLAAAAASSSPPKPAECFYCHTTVPSR